MNRIKVDLPDGMLTDLDFERGSVPRSAYIRDVLSAHLYPGLRESADRAAARPVVYAQTEAAAPVVSDHRHRMVRTGETRPKGNGRGLEHQRRCDTDGFCMKEDWEG